MLFGGKLLYGKEGGCCFSLTGFNSDEFEASDFSDNAGLYALVTEYLEGGSDETDDKDVISSDEEMNDSVNEGILYNEYKIDTAIQVISI